MEIGYKKQVNLSFSDAIKKTRDELANEGFGIITEIDVKTTFKKKLGIEFSDLVILGACNPQFAHTVLSQDKEIGLLLPCNVIVYEECGTIFVSAVRPTILLNKAEDETLVETAEQVEMKLKKVIDSL